MDAFSMSRGAEVVVVGTDDDHHHLTALQAVGRRGRGQNLNNKLSEVMEDFKALTTVSAHARVLINVAKVKSFRGSIVASARGLEFNEDENGNVVLNEEGKPSLNEAMSAEKCAYSRAVLAYTDAVALLQSSTSDSVETTRIASAAQWVSKIEKSARN
jgi:hypothetical protein